MFYLFLFVVLDAFGVSFSKYFFNLGVHPYFFVFLSGLTAALLLLTYLLIKKISLLKIFNKQTIKSALPTSIFISLASLFGFLSLKYISPTNYALLFRTNLLFIPWLSKIILKEKASWLLYPLGLVVLTGVWLLNNDWTLYFNVSGYSLALLAALMSAFDFIYQKKATININKDVVAFWRRLISAIAVGSIWLLTPQLGFSNKYFIKIMLFGIGLFLISLALIRALVSQKVAKVNLYSNITVMLIALISYFAFNERLTSIQILGGGLIMGAIIVYNIYGRYDLRNNSG